MRVTNDRVAYETLQFEQEVKLLEEIQNLKKTQKEPEGEKPERQPQQEEEDEVVPEADEEMKEQ